MRSNYTSSPKQGTYLLLNFLQRVQALDCVQRGPYRTECYEAINESQIYEPKSRLTSADELFEMGARTCRKKQSRRGQQKDREQNVAERVVFVPAREFAMQDAGKRPGQPTAGAGQAGQVSEKADLDPC